MRKVEQELSGEEQEDDEKMQLMTLGVVWNLKNCSLFIF